MKILTWNAWLVSLAFVILLAGCQNQSEKIAPNPIKPEAISKDEIALQVVDLLKQTTSRSEVIHSLKAQMPSVALATILDKVNGRGIKNAATQNLRRIVQKSEATYKNVDAPKNVEIPELWLHQPQSSLDFSKLLVAYAPDSKDEADWKKVKAYTLDKKVVYLDPFKAPNVPVVVVETDGFEALKVEADLMNRELQKSGVQRLISHQPNGKAKRTAGGLETTKLDRIRLNNDEEPWISGAAEIYAITSGVRGSNNEAQIQVIPMYYLDYDGTTYYPNQILLFWDDYSYQAANIQLFEKDDNYNYKEMVGIIVDGVFKITGTLTGEPIVGVLGQIANAVIQAMPDQWFTNDDDYVDSYYTIEKNKTYRNHNGARGNANVDLTPYLLLSN